MIERVNVLGVQVSVLNMDLALATIDSWIQSREPHYVAVTPAHVVMDGYRDPGLRGILNGSGMTAPDGMSLVWLLGLLGHRHVRRVYGPDLMLAMCARSIEGGYRHFLYGGAPGVAEALATSLLARFPGLVVVGTHSPPLHELTIQEDETAIAAINAANPDMLWVGISSPKQERWMASHLGKVSAPVLIGVGAAFDFLSGMKPQAPRWMQRTGLEWLFRLATEPRRLWPRYRQYPLFVVLVLAQMLGLRRYPLSED